MKKICKHAAAGFAALLLPTACDDPSAASTGNFEKVLQLYYDVHPVCVSLPIELPLASSLDIHEMTHRQLDTLVNLGLLSVTAQTGGSAPLGLGRAGDASYAVTAAGETIVRKGADRFIGGTDICFAHRQVIEVESFTPPAELIGVKVSRITYEYRLKDVEPWARGEAIQDAFPGMKSVLARPTATAVDTLVLTLEGWLHERAVAGP